MGNWWVSLNTTSLAEVDRKQFPLEESNRTMGDS